MVNYVLPKYITAAKRDAATIRWSASALSIDAPAPRVPTCGRCIQNIAKEGPLCHKPTLIRCRKCTKGHRVRCRLVGPEWYGRYERMYELWDLYQAAVAAVPAAATPAARAAARRADPNVQATGAKLARAQRLLTSEWIHHKRTARNLGVLAGTPSHRPTTAVDYMALMLNEERRQANAQEDLVKLVRRFVNRTADDDESEDSGGDSDDDGDEVEVNQPPESSQNLMRNPRTPRTRRAAPAPGNGGTGGDGGGDDDGDDGPADGGAGGSPVAPRARAGRRRGARSSRVVAAEDDDDDAVEAEEEEEA